VSASAPSAASLEVERLAERVRGARSVVVLTGAGISVPSGIPDFRTLRTGLWANVALRCTRRSRGSMPTPSASRAARPVSSDCWTSLGLVLDEIMTADDQTKRGRRDQ